MSKTPLGSIALCEAALIRTVTGAPVAADSTPYTFDPTAAAIGAGWRSVLLWAVVTGPIGNETVVVQVAHRVGAAWGAVADVGLGHDASTTATADVMGRDFQVAIRTVSGSPTQVDIYAAGWEPLRYDGTRVG